MKKLFVVTAALVLAVGAAGVVSIAAQQVERERGRSRALEILGGRGAQIGVDVRDVEQADIKREKLSTEIGAVVEEVRADSPASKAGFKAGDVVIEFDGERVRSARQLTRLVQETAAGREVKTVVVRGGQRVTLAVTPDTSSGLAILGPDFRTDRIERWGRELGRELGRDLGREFGRREFYFDMPDMPNIPFEFNLGTRSRIGVGVSELTPQLSEYFGVRDGVLVTSVETDSAAARAGLKAGDVITAINGQRVGSASELRREIADAEGSTVSLTVTRDRKEATFKVEVEAMTPRSRRLPRRTV